MKSASARTVPIASNCKACLLKPVTTVQFWPDVRSFLRLSSGIHDQEGKASLKGVTRTQPNVTRRRKAPILQFAGNAADLPVYEPRCMQSSKPDPVWEGLACFQQEFPSSGRRCFVHACCCPKEDELRTLTWSPASSFSSRRRAWHQLKVKCEREFLTELCCGRLPCFRT